MKNIFVYTWACFVMLLQLTLMIDRSVCISMSCVVLFIIYTLFSSREFLALFLHVPGIGGIKLSSCSTQLRLNRYLSCR